MLGLLSLIGVLIGTVAAFARAKVGALAVVALILAAGAVVTAVRGPHPFGLGLFTIAAVQISYVLVAYTQVYLQERASRCAMQNAIGQQLKLRTNRKQRFVGRWPISSKHWTSASQHRAAVGR